MRAAVLYIHLSGNKHAELSGICGIFLFVTNNSNMFLSEGRKKRNSTNVFFKKQNKNKLSFYMWSMSPLMGRSLTGPWSRFCIFQYQLESHLSEQHFTNESWISVYLSGSKCSWIQEITLYFQYPWIGLLLYQMD